MKRPDFFIVGAPKCGTTALNTYLKSHPEIFMPAAKELHFFYTDGHFRPHLVYTQEQFLSHFEAADPRQRAGEASVYHLQSRAAAGAIHKFAPDAKIIIMLREPSEMMYSLHSQLLFNGDEDIEDFEAALEAEADRRQGRRLPRYVSLRESLYYRDIATYTPQVERYLDTFGEENVHVIIYDDFRRNTAEVFRDTLRFLGVSEDFEPNLEVVNPNTVVRSKWLRHLLNETVLAIPQPVRRAIQLMVPTPLRHRLWRRLSSLNTRAQGRPPLDPALRRRLQEEFAPEIERLSQLLKRDLTHWSDTATAGRR